VPRNGVNILVHRTQKKLRSLSLQFNCIYNNESPETRKFSGKVFCGSFLHQLERQPMDSKRAYSQKKIELFR